MDMEIAVISNNFKIAANLDCSKTRHSRNQLVLDLRRGVASALVTLWPTETAQCVPSVADLERDRDSLALHQSAIGFATAEATPHQAHS